MPKAVAKVWWLGPSLDHVDVLTREAVRAYPFVIVMPFGLYSYVEFLLDWKVAPFIYAYVHMLPELCLFEFLL